jgi:hypothetical protein
LGLIRPSTTPLSYELVSPGSERLRASAGPVPLTGWRRSAGTSAQNQVSRDLLGSQPYGVVLSGRPEMHEIKVAPERCG